jgi:hypothetical protein
MYASGDIKYSLKYINMSQLHWPQDCSWLYGILRLLISTNIICMHTGLYQDYINPKSKYVLHLNCTRIHSCTSPCPIKAPPSHLHWLPFKHRNSWLVVMYLWKTSCISHHLPAYCRHIWVELIPDFDIYVVTVSRL